MQSPEVTPKSCPSLFPEWHRRFPELAQTWPSPSGTYLIKPVLIDNLRHWICDKNVAYLMGSNLSIFEMRLK